MSLEELNSLERIENCKNIRLKETYSVYKLYLSKLFIEILLELKKEVPPILDMHILLYSLKFVPFKGETKGEDLLEAFKRYIEMELNENASEWTCKKIYDKLENLIQLNFYEDCIEGSLIVYHNYEIEWDLNVHMIAPSSNY